MRKITLGTLNISNKGKTYVNDVLDTNRLSYGPYTRALEEAFAKAHECKHAIFMNSGTSALQVSLAALKEVYGYKDGDEVLVPATTFIATSNIVLQNNMVPVFVDVDPYTFNIDPRQLHKHLTSRTRAIIPVHLFGLPANMPQITDFADYNNLQVIEDSCETMLAKINYAEAYGLGEIQWMYKNSVGSFGDFGCFSTYVAHLVVGGVGGFVTTDNDRLADIARSLMQHGRDTIYTNIDQDDNPTAAMLSRRYSFDRVGYSYRATEMEAAIALSELERAEDNIARRRVNASYLTRLLYGTPLQVPLIPAGYEHSFMMYPMVLDKNYDLSRFLLYLENNGIETRLMFPLLTTPIYQKLFPGMAEKYPVSDHLGKQGFFIGMHQDLRFIDMEYISEVIHNYFKYDYVGGENK
jgi:perosamine synthetase